MFKFKSKTPTDQLGELEAKFESLKIEQEELEANLRQAQSRSAALTLDEALGDSKAAAEAQELDTAILTLKRQISGKEQAIKTTEALLTDKRHEAKRSERLKSIADEQAQARAQVKQWRADIKLLEPAIEVLERNRIRHNLDGNVDHLRFKISEAKELVGTAPEEIENQRTAHAVEIEQWAEEIIAEGNLNPFIADARMGLAKLTPADHERVAYHRHMGATDES